MRSDLASMTPGKAAAQVAHAATAHAIRFMKTDGFNRWIDDRLFGTTVVLDGGSFYPNIPDEIQDISDGIVLDPTYPIQDGRIKHYLPIETCAWAFLDAASNDKRLEIIKKYKLYNGLQLQYPIVMYDQQD